jgi:hypothetical protein
MRDGLPESLPPRRGRDGMADAEAVSIVNDLMPEERGGVRRLGDGRYLGDPLPVGRLRDLGIQDGELGLTTLGDRVLAVLDLDCRAQSAAGVLYRWS